MNFSTPSLPRFIWSKISTKSQHIRLTDSPKHLLSLPQANDIAVVQVAPLHWTGYVRPICLPNNEDAFVGWSGEVAGWGQLWHSESLLYGCSVYFSLIPLVIIE